MYSMDGCTVWIDAQYKRMDGWMDGWMVGWMDSWMDGINYLQKLKKIKKN